MISSPWFLPGLCAASASATVALLWLPQVPFRDASHVVPALLLAPTFSVTAIPAAAAQAVRSRGDDRRRHQREVSVFVPRPPRRRP